MKIVLFVGDNPYGSTAWFAQALGSALERQGASVRIFPLSEENASSTFTEILNNPPEITCSFSDITIGRVPIGEMWQIPHVSFLIDPCLYFLHQAKGDFSCVTTADKEDYNLLKELGCKRVLFMPHAVPKELVEQSNDGERPLDLVFFGTCIDCEEIEEGWKQHSQGDLLIEASKQVLSPDGPSCFQALVGLGLSPHDGLFFECFGQLDLYIRGKDRLELIRALHGFRITVFGEKQGKRGWQELLQGQENIDVRSPVSFSRAVEIMQQAKIVLNSNPRLKHGSHERIFYGIACGACVVTGEGSFKIHNDLITYPYGHWGMVREKVETLLQNSAQREARVKALKKTILEQHTWDVRAQTLLELLPQWHKQCHKKGS